MKTTDRLADLEERVGRLEARNAEVECIEREIVQAMRQYARLDSLGYDVDADGVRCIVKVTYRCRKEGGWSAPKSYPCNYFGRKRHDDVLKAMGVRVTVVTRPGDVP